MADLTVPTNPIVRPKSLSDTLENCIAVLRMLDKLDVEACDERDALGLNLVLSSVTEAVEHVHGRLTAGAGS